MCENCFEAIRPSDSEGSDDSEDTDCDAESKRAEIHHHYQYYDFRQQHNHYYPPPAPLDAPAFRLPHPTTCLTTHRPILTATDLNQHLNHHLNLNRSLTRKRRKRSRENKSKDLAATAATSKTSPPPLLFLPQATLPAASKLPARLPPASPRPLVRPGFLMLLLLSRPIYRVHAPAINAAICFNYLSLNY